MERKGSEANSDFILVPFYLSPPLGAALTNKKYKKEQNHTNKKKQKKSNGNQKMQVSS